MSFSGFMVIDVETNGLMDYKRPADADGQPRVAEFAAITTDLKGDVLDEYQRYIKPDGWSMSSEISEINKITDSMLLEQGVPISEALNFYAARIELGYPVIAFGAQFDCKLMRAELRRAGRDDLFEKTPNICLMRSARPFAKQIGRDLVKASGSNKGWPKLIDLCGFCGVPIGPKLHGGLEDARLAQLCFRYMLEHGFEPKPEVHHSRNYEEIKNNV